MTPSRAAPRALLRFFLAGGLGGCLALSGPPLSQYALAALPAFAFSPLLLLLVRDQSPGRAALLGLVAGVGFGAYSLRFTLDVLARFADLGTLSALPVALLLALLQALPLALATGGARLADTPSSSRLHLTLPLAIVAAFGFTPVLFPWHLGHFTLPWLAWAQQAELGGLPLVDLLTALLGCCALEAWRARSRPLAVASGLLLLLPALHGYGSLDAVEQGRARAPALRVGVVQPNVSVAALRGGLSPAARLERLEGLTRQAEALGAQLVLWPEAAYPLTLSRASLADRAPETLAGLGPRRARRAALHAPSAAGEPDPLGEPDTSTATGPPAGVPRVLGAMSAAGRCETWNTLVAVDAAGRPLAHVDKRELFPFAEYVPFWSWSPWLQRRYPCAGEQSEDQDPVVEVGHARLGLLNCYEDVGPERARRATRAGAQLLLNFSNDAWFGSSVQPELHRVVARFRAIETRRDLVRVVNTGASGHISATGQELLVLARHQPTAAVVDARLLTGTTLSVRVGAWVAVLALLVLTLLGLTRLPLARRGPARQSQPPRG